MAENRSDSFRELDSMISQLQNSVRSLEEFERTISERCPSPHLKPVEEDFQKSDLQAKELDWQIERIWEGLHQSSQPTAIGPHIRVEACTSRKAESVHIPLQQHPGHLRRLSGSTSSVLSSDSGYRSRDPSASRLPETGVDPEKGREYTTKQSTSPTKRDGLGKLSEEVEEEGEKEEEEGEEEEEGKQDDQCEYLIKVLNDTMEQVQQHLKEMEDSESSEYEHHPQLQLKKVEETYQRVETQLTELQQEINPHKDHPPQLEVSKSANPDRHSQVQLEQIAQKCRTFKKQLDELRQEIDLLKQSLHPPPQHPAVTNPPNMVLSLFPPIFPHHNLPSPQRPPREQLRKDTIKSNLPHFVTYTSLGTCMAHLISNQVIGEQTASYYLILTERTESQKNMLFYTTVLPSAGEDAYSRLHQCLRATAADHPGHECLVKLLDEAFET